MRVDGKWGDVGVVPWAVCWVGLSDAAGLYLLELTG